MSLKIIGSGFGRTGTMSLKAALEILGFGPCYHMEEVIKRPSHIKLWQQIGHNQPVPWPRIFSRFQATVDFPASIFYRELLDLYPEAKVIHTVRDAQRWYESTTATIYPAANYFPAWVPRFVPPLHRFVDMQERLIWQRVFNGRFPNRAYAIQRFHDYTEEVKQHVPPEKLLIFQVKDGWEPLCAFLDVPVPDRPFPHVNDRETMRRRFKLLQIATFWLPLGVAALGLALLLRQRLLQFAKLKQSNTTQASTA
jgi:hypothetical protein